VTRRSPLASARPWLLAGALYAALVLLITWPLVPCLTTHLPLGELPHATVPWFNLWTLEWNADRFAHGLVGYWDAPIFHPARNTFAFSEPQALTAVPFSVLRPWLGSIGAYNATLLLALLLNGLCARRFVRVAGVSDAAATWAGALALGLPFALKELGVLQLTVLAPSLLVLAELALLFRVPRGAVVVRAALAFAAVLWTCVYYALLLGLLLLVACVVLLVRARLRRRLRRVGWRAALLALCAFALLAAPLVLVQRSALAAFERAPEVIRRGSASGWAYARLPAGSASARLLPVLAAPPGKRSLYPGAVLVALALAGFAVDRRGPRRAFAGYAALALVLALLVSFGTRLSLGPWPPYALVQQLVPGFAQLRSPYRMAVFVQLLLVLFAGFGLHALARSRARWAFVAAPLLVALALFEVVPWGTRLRRFPEPAMVEPWIAWLARHPGGAVAMVPPSLSGKARDYEPTALAMLQGLRHGHPLVNGYSGFFPRRADRVAHHLQRFPRAGDLRALRRAGVVYAVVDRAWLARQRYSAADLAALRTVFASDQRAVYALEPE